MAEAYEAVRARTAARACAGGTERLARPGEQPPQRLKRAIMDDDEVSMTMAPETDVAQLSLEELRAHRRALLTECVNTSRWRRLVQARLDLAVATAAPPDALQRPTDDHPAPPEAGELRELVEAPRHDAVGLLMRLDLAQRALSGYGASVEAAASLATRELVERYAAEPGGCLSRSGTS